MSALYERDGKRIEVEPVFLPLPRSCFRFQATQEGYEPGDPVGLGKTEQEAIADLFIEMEESA